MTEWCLIGWVLLSIIFIIMHEFLFLNFEGSTLYFDYLSVCSQIQLVHNQRAISKIMMEMQLPNLDCNFHLIVLTLHWHWHHMLLGQDRAFYRPCYHQDICILQTYLVNPLHLLCILYNKFWKAWIKCTKFCKNKSTEKIISAMCYVYWQECADIAALLKSYISIPTR